VGGPLRGDVGQVPDEDGCLAPVGGQKGAVLALLRGGAHCREKAPFEGGEKEKKKKDN